MDESKCESLQGQDIFPFFKSCKRTVDALGLLFNVHRGSFPWVERPEQVDQVFDYNP